MTVVTLFSLQSLLEALVGKAKTYGGGLIIFIGVLMIAVAAFKVGKGLMTQGKPNAQPINWFLCGGLLLVGGAFAFGGMKTLAKMSYSMTETADDLTQTNNTDKMFRTDDNDHTSNGIKFGNSDSKSE